MSNEKKIKEERLVKLRENKRKKEERMKKIKNEIDVINKRIIDIEDSMLLQEAEESKIILSDSEISLVAITKALKEGNFDYLKSLHQSIKSEEELTPGQAESKELGKEINKEREL